MVSSRLALAGSFPPSDLNLGVESQSVWGGTLNMGSVGSCHPPLVGVPGLGVSVWKTFSWQYDVGSGGGFLMNLKSSWHNYVFGFFILSIVGFFSGW